MEIAKHLPTEQILLNVSAGDKWELIGMMAEAIVNGPDCRDIPDDIKKRIAASVVQREKQANTNLGEGIAFPHGRVAGLTDWFGCLATLKTELDFEGTIDRPVKIVFMAVTPEETPTVAIRLMRAVAMLFSDETVRSFIGKRHDPQEIHEYLSRQNLNVEAPITAHDIMRRPTLTVSEDTSLKKVISQMHANRLEAVPVLNENEEVTGEITCDNLFCRGMPDFFSQLQTVSFIKEFDPFERYFQNEAQAVALDVMSSDFATLPEDDTLMEVVYLLSVKKYAKIYVTRNGRLAGIIDRAAVLDRILNY